MTPDEYTCSEQMLNVSDGHSLYVHDWGNKEAKRTYLFLHGGPGVGCSDSHKGYFDGRRDHVIFFDQRGAGKSTPAGSLEANTTQHLVQDIEAILDTLKANSVTIVGGSWGSCLALAYALEHPTRVDAMILRGLFTGSQAEIDHIDKGMFRNFFPDVWEAFLSRTPDAYRHDPAAYHGPRAIGNDPEAMTDAAYAYSELEGALLDLDDRHKPEDKATFSPNATRIEVYYLQNHCFLPERHILDNAHKLTMPVWLVQGRYDMVCPPVTAYELHKRLPNSRLQFTVAGHSGGDRGNFEAIRVIVSSI